MTSLISAANTILPWKRRIQWLLNAGWKCSGSTRLNNHDVLWYNPYHKYIYRSQMLALMSSDSFKKLISQTIGHFHLLRKER